MWKKIGLLAVVIGLLAGLTGCLTVRDLASLDNQQPQENDIIGSVEIKQSFFNPIYIENHEQEKEAVLQKVESDVKAKYGDNVQLYGLKTDGYPTWLSFLSFGMFWKAKTNAVVVKSDSKLDLHNTDIYNFVDEDTYDNFENDRKKTAKYVEQGFTTTEIEAIESSKVFVGMSESALIESWGKPLRINETRTAYGVHRQYVYPNKWSTSYPCVYVDNGKVTAIQN